MASFIFLLYFSSLLFFVLSKKQLNNLKSRDLYATKVRDYAYWPNATIPFHINPQHFDKEQSLSITSTLAMYAFKTCLQFNPVMAEPGFNQHVLSFENPGGVRKCVIGLEGHAKEEPHRIVLGYDCLKTPHIDMLIMKALGFPFEHNRASRDVYVDVQFENIEMGSMTLFTKEKKLPMELRALPYDVDSVMHFGERDFSKNGHRTIIFKSEKMVQNRAGLSKLDLRKIDLVYGPECLKRERQAKIDICRNYPVVRKKRDIDLATVGSLRVNSDITPPPDVPDVPDQRNLTDEVMNSLNKLGIENEIQDLIDQIHKITATALENAKSKYCNVTNNIKGDRRLDDNEPSPDFNAIINSVDKYMTSVVHHSVGNLTIFCDGSNSTELFQRVRCGWGTNNRCPMSYKSTRPGIPKYSTQHRPYIGQSTKHKGRGKQRPYINILRSKQSAEESSTLTRRKRDLDAIKVEIVTSAIKAATDVKPEAVKDNLRMATKIYSEKRVNYAPLRKHFRESVRNEDNEDGSEVTQERRQKKRVKSRISRPHQEVIKLEIESNKDDQSSNKKIKEYTDNKELEERNIDKRKKKRIRKERIGFRTPQIVRLSKENKDYYRERMWPGGAVKYIIKENLKYDTNKVRERLEEVNKILRRKTCVALQEILEEPEKETDYLVIDTSRDYVTGRVGGKQNFGSLELFEGGQHRQHAAMMVMAMLGFYFEVSRHDRDQHIRIHNRHIRPDKLHHFEKIRSEATFPLAYDYASATQPAWQFWRKLGKTGISSVATYKDQDPQGFIMKSLGQNAQLLSDSDIIKINSIYGVKCFQNQRRMKLRYTKTVK